MTEDTQTPGLIPDQLLSNIQRGACVLFLGADLPLGYEGAPLSQPRLAAAQAKAHEYVLDRLSLSLVLQACGRGIRSETDRCAFVLLDWRYHDYGWRRFLEPSPHNVRPQEMNVQDLHQERTTVPELAWDAALTRFAEQEEVR